MSNKPEIIGMMKAVTDPEELNCSVCLDIFEHPVELPCKHTLCLQCWKKILKSDSKCPVCRFKVRDPSFVYVNEVLWNHIKTNHRDELIERKADLTDVIPARRPPKRDLVAEMANLRELPEEQRIKAEQERRDELLAWKLQKQEQKKEERHRAKQVRLDRRLAKSLEREEKTKAKEDGTHWNGNMQLWTHQDESEDSDSSIEVLSDSYRVKPSTSQGPISSLKRPSPRTINVTSGTSEATVQLKSLTNSSATSTSLRVKIPRIIWNPAFVETNGADNSDTHSETRKLKSKWREYTGPSMPTSHSVENNSRCSRATSTVTSGAYEREMQEEGHRE